tara:strand:+ start:1152 stop:2057 length:906 start_codon:yes stop_codon:yes gene_type:complete
MDLKSKIILISGPTASGKSEQAEKLAKKIGGEIINTDSMQVYKQLKILTARPTEQDSVKHHLYGFISVKKKFSTGNWIRFALKKIKEIRSKGKVPIFVGGTGLYFKSLTEGLVKIPNIPSKFRNLIRTEHSKIGQDKFYLKLIKIDPKIINYINPKDSQRTLRAYEIKKFTKISMVDWFKKTKRYFEESNFIKIYFDVSRNILIKRINKRVINMFARGAVKEVIKFNKLNVKKNYSANKVIGIKEINEYLNKEASLAQTKEKIAIKTRQYAKRQSTWSRKHMNKWRSIDPLKVNLMEEIIK